MCFLISQKKKKRKEHLNKESIGHSPNPSWPSFIHFLSTINATFVVRLELTDLVLHCVLCRDGFGTDLAGRVAVFWSALGMVNMRLMFNVHKSTAPGKYFPCLRMSPRRIQNLSFI